MSWLLPLLQNGFISERYNLGVEKFNSFEMIKLVSSDNRLFKVERKVIEMSGLIKKKLENMVGSNLRNLYLLFIKQ